MHVSHGAAILPVLSCCCLLTSCDQAKQWLDSGLRRIDALTGRSGSSTAMSGPSGEQKPSLIPKDDGHVAPSWQAQLDQDAAGVIFRKDLPFPANVSSKTTCEEHWDLRMLVQSGQPGAGQALRGIRSSIEEVTRNEHRLRCQRLLTDWSPATPSAAPPSKAPGTAPASPAKPSRTALPRKPAASSAENTWSPASESAAPWSLSLKQEQNNWVIADRPQEFHAAFAASQLAGMAHLVPVAYAVAPRPLWFGRHRIQPGTVIPVPESQLSMLMDGQSLQGSLSLTFEKVEGVGGHPCGRFAISGHLRRRGIPTMVDPPENESITIESGQIWLSTIHPVILKSDWQAIVTRQLPGVQLQGTIRRHMTRSWSVTQP